MRYVAFSIQPCTRKNSGNTLFLIKQNSILVPTTLSRMRYRGVWLARFTSHVLGYPLIKTSLICVNEIVRYQLPPAPSALLVGYKMPEQSVGEVTRLQRWQSEISRLTNIFQHYKTPARKSMTKRTRPNHSESLKAKVALASLRGIKR
jgi:hypothetical protein